MKFDYKDYQTTTYNNQRWYIIDENTAYPSITTVLGGTISTEKQKMFDAWKTRVR